MKMRRFAFSSSFLLSGLVAPTIAQTVWIVDANNGPGTSFTTIGAAIAAASDGDFVLVRDGFYPEVVRLDGIGLTLQAEAGATVTVQAIEVENLAPSQFAALRGFDRWYAAPGGQGGDGGTGMVVQGASVVDLIGSTVKGGAGGHGGQYGFPGSKGQAFVISGGAVVNNFPNKTAHLMASPSPVRAGATTPVSLTGDPGDLVYVVVSSEPGPFLTARNWVGPLVLSSQFHVVRLGVLSGSGSLSLNVKVPPLPPGVLEASCYLQAVFLGGREIALGTPTQVHMLAPSL